MKDSDSGHLAIRCGRPISLLALWVAINLFLGGMPLGDNIYLSQIALLCLCFAAVIRFCLKLRYAPMAGALLLVILALVWVFAVGAPKNIRFVPEFFKLILLLVPGLFLSGVIKWKDLIAISRLMPSILLLILIWVRAFGLGDYYGDEGRFGVPWWGSPNNTGFVIAIALAMILFDLKRHKNDNLNKLRMITNQWFKWFQLLLLIIFLFKTQSLGGLLTASVVMLRYCGFGLKTIMRGTLAAVIVFIVVVFFVHIIQIPELIGSGRLIIWETLVSDLFSNSPFVWVFGYGPGAIDFTPWFTARVESAHSMYIEILYGYGLFGLLMFVGIIYQTAHALIAADLSAPERFILEAIFCALVVSFFVDTYFMTAQLTWLGALLLGMRGLVSAPVRHLCRQ